MKTYIVLLIFAYFDFSAAINAAINPVDVVESVKFYLYTNQNPEEPQIINYNDDSVAVSNYDSSHKTKIIIHGWYSNYTRVPNRPIREAYLVTGSYNVISVDWRKYANMEYITVASKVLPEVGAAVAKLIDFLYTNYGLNFNELVVIGHSLGAHIAGFAGKQVKLGKIEAIVGIDAALPFINVDDPSQRLSITDANYVVTIHATIGKEGIIKPVGHTAFYPNWGRRLEGCGVDTLGLCSHNAAPLVYAAGVRGYSYAPIYQCSSFEEILEETGCNKEVDVQVGDPLIVKKLPGIFYFEIKDASKLALLF
ncbi:pancreatic triacylglycerol lipase-like isoform X2 [Teleopsis dalmanni]|uniref:pancreatic triacylglycerol lipase-like isoform X2 n=1 Tax=Teleopsis dalmanni TaxID=139649 RepID=UPI0018CF2DE2|nr:pancreatic triacylglycerol lipase-like isoform X2 [Teleopsis dalmanni]